ncbi:MAG: hypothetical protein CMJ49_03220 [Planctomycetaceae bacterium]|nr:hypothetical protein [Planctomycetaceae bacterium]
MLHQALEHCAALAMPRLLLFAAVITIAMRFGLKLQSTRDTRFLRHLTFGLRIHHGYIGILLAILAPICFQHQLGPRNLTLIIALILSDLIHHFLILWPITGSPEFHLIYPKKP